MEIRPLNSRLKAILGATKSPTVPSHLESLIFNGNTENMANLGTAPVQLQHARFHVGELMHAYAQAYQLDNRNLLRAEALAVIAHQGEALKAMCAGYISEMSANKGYAEQINWICLDTSWCVRISKIELPNFPESWENEADLPVVH